MNWSNMQPGQVTSRWSLPWGVLFWVVVIVICVHDGG